MAKLHSIQEQVEYLVEIRNDLNVWEKEFVTSIARRMKANDNQSTCLSEKQIAVIEKTFDKHKNPKPDREYKGGYNSLNPKDDIPF